MMSLGSNTILRCMWDEDVPQYNHHRIFGKTGSRFETPTSWQEWSPNDCRAEKHPQYWWGSCQTRCSGDRPGGVVRRKWKIKAIPLSDNAVQRRNCSYGEWYKRASGHFKKPLCGLYALQLDESTDISSAFQLMFFVSYVMDKKSKGRVALFLRIEDQHKGKKLDEFVWRVQWCRTSYAWIKMRFSDAVAQESNWCYHHSMFYLSGNVSFKDLSRRSMRFWLDH